MLNLYEKWDFEIWNGKKTSKISSYTNTNVEETNKDFIADTLTKNYATSTLSNVIPHQKSGPCKNMYISTTTTIIFGNFFIFYVCTIIQQFIRIFFNVNWILNFYIFLLWDKSVEKDRIRKMTIKTVRPTNLNRTKKKKKKIYPRLNDVT